MLEVAISSRHIVGKEWVKSDVGIAGGMFTMELQNLVVPVFCVVVIHQHHGLGAKTEYSLHGCI